MNIGTVTMGKWGDDPQVGEQHRINGGGGVGERPKTPFLLIFRNILPRRGVAGAAG